MVAPPSRTAKVAVRPKFRMEPLKDRRHIAKLKWRRELQAMSVHRYPRILLGATWTRLARGRPARSWTSQVVDILKKMELPMGPELWDQGTGPFESFVTEAVTIVSKAVTVVSKAVRITASAMTPPLTSFVKGAQDSCFPIQNLPYGIFRLRSENMFARGGKMAVVLLSRQLAAPAGTISVIPCPSRRSMLPLLSREDVSRRDFSTEVIGGPVDEERRRLLNRILYRSKQRGYLELDLLLGKWAQENINKLDDEHLGALVKMLDEENPDLLKWLTGQDQAPENMTSNPVFSAIHKKVTERLDNHSSSETRARPGSPWVRGWDDNQKGGAPKIGNQ